MACGILIVLLTYRRKRNEQRIRDDCIVVKTKLNKYGACWEPELGSIWGEVIVELLWSWWDIVQSWLQRVATLLKWEWKHVDE